MNPYVMDGLVAMWDGIWNNGNMHHENELLNGWVDCINGFQANVVNRPNALLPSYSIEKDHIICNRVNIVDTSKVLLDVLKTNDAYSI